MKIRKVVSRVPKDGSESGTSVAVSINAAVSAQTGEDGPQHTRVSSHQRIVQRNGRTEVFEEGHSFDDAAPENDQEESRE